jgi:hypothetical protein
MTRERVLEKFRRYVGLVLPDERVEELAATVFRLDELDSVRRITALV